MNWLTRLLKSSIGAKAIMAVTGLLLLGFVIGHLLGNLQMFLGQDAVNSYAQGLRDLGPLLWVVRIGLLVVFLAHIATGIRLANANENARPVAYQKPHTIRATPASRSMALTGIVILAYVLFHLAHLTFGVIYPDYADLVDAQGRHDVYSMAVLGFQEWWLTGTYLIAMGVLGLHLRHGISSFFQTLGLNHPRYNPVIEKLGPAGGGLIVLGYVSIPLGVLAGIIQLPAGVN
jgi:succinate dehydrogenase / fumarate reductase cytochrome b subunit